MSAEFSEVRDVLCTMRQRLGGDCLVGFAFDGALMRFTVARPESGVPVFVATFDGQNDYRRKMDDVASEIVLAATSHFSIASS